VTTTASFAIRFNFTGKSMLHRLRHLARDDQGAALIEAAVVFPFLFVLAFGAFEFSNIIYAHHLMTTGIRDAARYLARTDAPLTHQATAQNLAATGTVNGAGERRVSWWAPSNVVVSVTTVSNPVVNEDTGERRYRGGANIQIVEVRTDVSYPGMGALNVIGLDAISFRVSHTERVIGE
jgi:Flp pilus assembly protein TadG